MTPTVVGWMFEHPWMTFFILMTLAAAVSVPRKIVIRERSKD